MPAEMRARMFRNRDIRSVGVSACPGRLSSFGFSGTIAHGAFAPPLLSCVCSRSSLKGVASFCRAKATPAARGHLHMVPIADEQTHQGPQDPTCEYACIGTLSSATEIVMCSHIISNNILFPGVGYAEMVFACSSSSHSTLAAMSFVRPFAI